MKTKKNESNNSVHKKETVNYYFKEETPCIVDRGFGYRYLHTLYPGWGYELTNLRLEDNQVYTFELWDDQGYIATYWILRTLFERNAQKIIQNYLEDFPKTQNSEFSALPVQGNEARIQIEEDEIFCEDIMEGLFLYLLFYSVKNGGNSTFRVSNSIFGGMVPAELAIAGWIGKSLDKFSSLGILEVSEDDVKPIPYTEIKIKLPVSYILFSSKEKLSV